MLTFIGAIPASGYYVSYSLPVNVVDLNCTGNESSIWNCPYNGTVNFYTCSSSHDASIICRSIIQHVSHVMKSFLDASLQPESCHSGNVRLIDGPAESAGRLEVCVNQVWGTVCSRSWGSSDSKVVCRQLGYQEIGKCLTILCLYSPHIVGSTYSSSAYGQGSGPIAFGYLYCNGNEQSIFDCNRNTFSVVSGSCSNHDYDLGLTCERKSITDVLLYTMCI